MYVNIKPSMINGLMNDDMAANICRHYVCGKDDTNINGMGNPINVIENVQYCYISRENPAELQDNNVLGPVQSLKTYKYTDNEGKFRYKSTSIPMQYYCVSNPENPGAVGIARLAADPGSRTMIVSSGLSGCGFAVLFYREKVYIIHAGASNNAVQHTDPNQRKRMINRDIYLMASALLDRNSYQNEIDALNRMNHINNGLTCEELFCLLQQKGFRGFVYVCRDRERLICDNEFMNLAVRSYHENYLYDVVCLINNHGNAASVLRSMDNTRITGRIIQNRIHISQAAL